MIDDVSDSCENFIANEAGDDLEAFEEEPFYKVPRELLIPVNNILSSSTTSTQTSSVASLETSK